MSFRSYDPRIRALTIYCHQKQIKPHECTLATLAELDRIFPNTTIAHFIAALRLLELFEREGGHA